MAKKRDDDAIVQPAPISHELEGLVNMRDKFTGRIDEDHFFDQYDDAKFMEIMVSDEAQRLTFSGGTNEYDQGIEET